MSSQWRKHIIVCLVLFAENFSSCLIIAEQMASRPLCFATNEQVIGCDYSSVNPSAFAVVGRACVSASVAPSPFGFAELSFSELYFGYRINDNIAVSASASGMAGRLYSCLGPRAAVNYALTKEFVLGLGAGMSYQRFENYSASTSGYFDVGSVISIAEGLSAGVSINNLGSGLRDERLFGLFSISYDLTDMLEIMVGSRAELGAIGSYYSELIFIPDKRLAIAVGGGTEPILYGARIGVALSDFSLTLRVYSTKELGWRLSSGIGYTFSK